MEASGALPQDGQGFPLKPLQGGDRPTYPALFACELDSRRTRPGPRAAGPPGVQKRFLDAAARTQHAYP
eukprot:5386140-Prymnesium_polylepis.1